MLNRQVLVLNKHWMAVHVCTVRRALTLMFQELARVVTEDFQTWDFESWRELSAFANSGTPLIHTPQFQLLLPQVIVLMRYNRLPPRTVKFNRRNIFLRDRHQCQYCGHRPKEDDLTIDHVVPRSRGGRSVWENVVLACTRCNARKGDRLPEESGLHPIRPPRKPPWTITLQHMRLDEVNRTLWQKFIDTVYWETNLRE
jgi:5-methylcytosine-specific restriction endonuclease McrA